MNDKRIGLVLWVTGTVWAASLCGCQIKKPTVELQDIEVTGIDLVKLEATFTFKVTNPNAFDIKLRRVDYELKTPEGLFASGRQDQPLTLPGGQAAMMHLPVSVRHTKLMEVARKIESGEGCPYEMDTRSRFRVWWLDLTVPSRHVGKVPAFQPPRVSFKTAKVTLELNPVVQVVLNVTNPNGFDLPSAEVSGSLRCGGEVLLELRKCPATAMPAGKTVEMVIPIVVGAHTAVNVTKSLAAHELIHFDGSLKITPPPSFKKMLLGEKGP